MSTQVVKPEDVIGMKSRISWSAILGGSVMAMTVYFILTLLCVGVNLSMSEAGVRNGTVDMVAVISGVASMLVALFLGGWVTSQLTVGENNSEAVIHGLLTWATVTALSVVLVGAGFRAGYNAMLGAALVANTSGADTSWESAARAAGVPEERIAQLRRDLDPENIRRNAEDPETQARARRGVMIGVWSILIASVLGMGTAAWGALVGAGPVSVKTIYFRLHEHNVRMRA